MEQFRQSVLDYVQLTDDVAEASKALNTSRKRLKDLRTVIIQHMTDNKIDQCNLKDGTLTLKSSKAPPPLNKELMVEALQQDLGSEKAEALADKVAMHRETNVQTKQSLKRTRARQLPAAPPAAAPAPAEGV